MTIPQKPEVLILSGLPASGKSTYAKNWVAEEPTWRKVINYDGLRLELYGESWKFNQPEEQKMKDQALARARGHLEQGISVVIDNTNLTPGARRPWVDLAKSFGIEPELYEVDTPLETCIRRDATRQGTKRVGRAVIERMALFNGFVDWNDQAHNGLNFIVVDVDGTLADISHRKHFVEVAWETGTECKAHIPNDKGKCLSCGAQRPKKDWDGFFKNVSADKPVESILRLVDLLAHTYNVIIVSGRGIDACGKETEDWLNQHMYCEYQHLFMRGWNDRREDYIVKQEILDLLPKDRIAYVLDDRNQVVDMWRRNGLTCLQVANGDF